jgi:hypothetical protein
MKLLLKTNFKKYEITNFNRRVYVYRGSCFSL